MTQLFHVRRGQGEPLLLIQGMSGHHLMWGEPFLNELVKDFDVVSYDHRGIGNSPRVDEQFTIVDLAQDAIKLLDELGWESAHIMGISMGGLVAQELALRHPERVRTLILGCTSPGGEGAFTAPGPLRMVEAMQTRDAELAVRRSFEVNVSPEFQAKPGTYEEFKQTVLALRVPAPVVMMQALAGVGHDAVDRLGALTAPTVVVHGTADQMILSAQGERLAELIAGARLELWDGVGHLYWWEQPERAAELLRQHALTR